MNIIFLDIDGVLNTFKHREMCPDQKYTLNPEKLHLLRNLLQATNANVVISSNWRVEGENLMNLFWNHVGAEYRSRWAGCTPISHHFNGSIWTAKPRYEEIQQWINEQDAMIKKFVILDDMDDMGFLSDHHIKTNWNEGLLLSHIEQAISRLSA